MEQRLKPVESYNLSKGLNTYSAPSTVSENELTTSENIRHKGPGRIIRRNGMEKFYATGVQPVLGSNYPATVVEQTRIGRLMIPYIQNVKESGKRSAILAVFVIGNDVYQCRDGGSVNKIRLQGSLGYARLPWKPRYTASGIYYENGPDVGAGFLDGKIYIGTSLEYSTEMLLYTNSYGFPYGCRITVTNLNSVGIFDVLTQAATGATGTVGYVDVTNKRIYLYDWNGINFSTAAGDVIAWTGTSLVPTTDGGDSPVKRTGRELALAGMILDYDSSSKVWSARKWGIDAPLAAPTVSEGPAGHVEAGTYNMKYTFIRYVGGSLSGTDNPKLSGGELVSESAPSPVASVTTGGGTKIDIESFDVPADPQVTHIRMYRDEFQLGAYHHVCDIAITTATSIFDNYQQVTLELEAVQPQTTGYQTFGQLGGNSGHAIEVADRRIFVAGNKTYPQRVYFSDMRSEHQHSEYFSSSIDLTESPGESITAIKWWLGRLFIFMERSVYEVDYTLTGDAQQVSKLQTKGVGCATRNGIVDMGSSLLVMTDGGLTEFDGTKFSDIPLTLPINDDIGTDFLDAILTKSNDYVYIITSKLRTANKIATLKYSDGSWACGLDVIASPATVPDCFSYVPPLTNFGNTVDDSDYVLGLFRSAYGETLALYYYAGKYDLVGNNTDLEIRDASASVPVTIMAKFSPRIFDFGGLADATIEKVIALIASCGDSDSTANSPTGEFVVRGYVDYSDDGYARLYTETKLTNDLPQNKVLTVGSGPIQTRFTKTFTPTYAHQTGGVMSDGNPAQGVPAYRKMVYEGSPKEIWGRLWKVVFEYASTNNFEFTGFAIKFTRREEA